MLIPQPKCPDKLTLPIQSQSAPVQNWRQVSARLIANEKAEYSGRMHVAFDQDVDVPDLFQTSGR